MIDLKLKQQTVLITGASSGIGHAIAIAMGGQGANVVINHYHDEKGADETLDSIEKAGGTGFIIGADVSKENEVIAMFETAIG